MARKSKKSHIKEPNFKKVYNIVRAGLTRDGYNCKIVNTNRKETKLENMLARGIECPIVEIGYLRNLKLHGAGIWNKSSEKEKTVSTGSVRL